MVTSGSYVFKVKFSGASQQFSFHAIFSKYGWFQTKRFTMLLKLIQIYKQNPLERKNNFHSSPKLYIGFDINNFLNFFSF